MPLWERIQPRRERRKEKSEGLRIRTNFKMCGIWERERANAWQETLCFLWAWWVWCVLLYSASKASETLLLSCQVNNTNKSGRRTYSHHFPIFCFSLQVPTPSAESRTLAGFTAWSLKANGMKWRRNTEWNSQSWNQSFPCLHRSQAAESALTDEEDMDRSVLAWALSHDTTV